MPMARLVVWVCALLFAGAGVAGAFAPASMAALAGIALPIPTAAVDYAAMYGGLELGLAAALCWCALHPSRVPAGLVVGGCAFAGFALVRAAWVVGSADAWPLMSYLAIGESATAVLCFWALRRAPAGSPGA